MSAVPIILNAIWNFFFLNQTKQKQTTIAFFFLTSQTTILWTRFFFCDLLVAENVQLKW